MSAKQAEICKKVPIKDNAASFCFIQQISIHTKAVLNLEETFPVKSAMWLNVGLK